MLSSEHYLAKERDATELMNSMGSMQRSGQDREEIVSNRLATAESQVVECRERILSLGYEKKWLEEALTKAKTTCSAHEITIANLRKEISDSCLGTTAEHESQLLLGWHVTFCILYLLGVFQMCLALTKKYVWVAFVDMWCCRNAGVMTSTTTFSGTVRSTAHESYHHNDDNYDDDDDGESPYVDNASSPEANSSIRISENDEAPGQSAGKTTSRSIVFEDIDEEQAGENVCSAIDEMKAENKF